VASGSYATFATGQSIGAWKVLGPVGNPGAVAVIQTKYAEPGNGVAFKAQEGLNAVDLTGNANQGSCGVQQTIPTVAGKVYQVSFYVGRAAGNSFYATPAVVMLSINSGAATKFTNSSVTAGTVNWQHFTKTFTATGSSTKLTFLNGQTTNNYTGLDNVSVTVVNTGTISGTVSNDVNGNGVKDAGEGGLAAITIFLDKNNNGVLDTGELHTLSTASGSYTFSNVALGAYPVRAIVPATYRATTANPVSVNLQSTTASANFSLSQTTVISGNVFHDGNGNKVKDAGEAGQAGVTVYLDLDNNSVFDFLDLKTTTDASGNYKFVVPFGTFTVREVAPGGLKQTTPILTLTVKQGQLATNNNIGNK